IEIQAYADTIKAPAHPDIEHRVWRQWRPSTIITGASPSDPCWRPNRVWRPDPATTRMRIPPPVVERRPTPGILRLPIPPCIRIDPMPAIAIWPPPAVNYYRARLPAPAESFQ